MMQVASQAVMKGMSQEGNTYFFDDGSIQLTMRVPFDIVVKEIYRVIHKGHGPQPPPQETIKAFQTTKWISENGYGAVPGRRPFFGPSAQPEAQAAAGPSTPPWAIKEQVVTGSVFDNERLRRQVRAEPCSGATDGIRAGFRFEIAAPAVCAEPAVHVSARYEDASVRQLFCVRAVDGEGHHPRR